MSVIDAPVQDHVQTAPRGDSPGSWQRWPVRSQPTAVDQFLRSQVLNTRRHAAALRPFRREEFGAGPAVPSEAHVQSANELISLLRRRMLAIARRVTQAASISAAAPSAARLHLLLREKDGAAQWVRHIEKVWNFYFELFGQRQSRYADWLLATDRIALDCYQAVYTGLAAPRSVPSPPPFSYMATGFSPATFRRGVPMTRLGKRANPFPLIELPYHRLINPWTLGAVHHEVSHNLQSDLGLWEVVPKRIYQRLRGAGVAPQLAGVWARWNKEIWADLCGLLLGGPAMIASLIDVVAMSPAQAQAFNPQGVHPVPYLRVLINLTLLHRMGFPAQAEAYRRMWLQMYPSSSAGTLPATMLRSFGETNSLVVDTICFQPYAQLGNKSLAEVVRFRPTHEEMTQEAAGRIATGTDPGIIPARFLVGAARQAVDRTLASSDQITRHFYQALVRR